MATHRTVWEHARTELRVIQAPADNISPQRVTLYVSDGVFTFCFPMSTETAHALAEDLIRSADRLQYAQYNP